MYFFSLPLRIIIFSLSCFLLLRLGLLYSHSAYFSTLSSKEIISALITGGKFDSATTMLFFSPMLLLMSFPFKFIQKKSVLTILAILCGTILIVMLGYGIADILYFGEVQRHIGAEVLNLSADKGALFDIAISSRLKESILGLVALIIIATLYYFFIIRTLQKPIKLSFHWMKKLGMWLGLALIYFVLFRGLVLSSRPINLSDAFTGSKLQQANLALNPVYTSYREIRNRIKQKPLNYVSNEELNDFIKDNANVFKWQNINNKPTNKNVVLILLESWSYKYIDGLAGGQYGATPFMDSIVEKSQVWDNFFAAGQRSIIGIQAILSSIPALQNHPTLGFGLELNEMSRIADIANQYDYRTVMMQSSARRSFHMDSVANALGFKEYYGKEDVPLVKKYPQEQPRFGWDYDALQFFAKKLSESSASQPFFAFMFTGTTHEPFPKIGDEFELFPYQAQGEKGFLNTLKYSDWAVSEFMRVAEKQAWYHNTIFIFTADHTLNAQSDLGIKDNFRIPLIIFDPSSDMKSIRHQELASQYDLFPTLMDIMGFNHKISTFGSSLLDENKKESVLVNQGDTLGVIMKDNWVIFNDTGVIEQNSSLLNNDKIEFETMKLKIQYADQLLNQNRWNTND